MKTQKPRARFFVEPKSTLIRFAMALMLASAFLRVVGCWGMWSDRSFAVMQLWLPVGSCILFILCLFLGKRAFPLTVLPVIMGVVFFAVKSLGFASLLHTVLCILLYGLVAALYSATAFGFIRTKWLLVPLFALPFLYHIFVEDLAALRNTEAPVTFSAGLQEISVLCIMLALLLTALAMKKKRPDELPPDLPKIKDPVVLPPERADSGHLSPECPPPGAALQDLPPKPDRQN